MQAERAWALGMQLKEEAKEKPRKKVHCDRRLNKAADYAKLLTTLCVAKAEDITILEAEVRKKNKMEVLVCCLFHHIHHHRLSKAYSSLINGNYLLEREKWKSSLEQFMKGLTLFQKLPTIDVDYTDICKSKVEGKIQFKSNFYKNGFLKNNAMLFLNFFSHIRNQSMHSLLQLSTQKGARRHKQRR